MTGAETTTRARKPTPHSDAFILELRKVMQRTHPDRGGTAESFHAGIGLSPVGRLHERHG